MATAGRIKNSILKEKGCLPEGNNLAESYFFSINLIRVLSLLTIVNKITTQKMRKTNNK
jgi:hypothetical protein